MKKNYIEIINSNLNKLDESQLFKVLVLVQNTVDAVRKSACEVGMTLRSKNVALFVGEAVDQRTINPKVYGYGDETDTVKNILFRLGLSSGYGIFSLYGKSSEDNGNINPISFFICFCIPDKIDGMIEINKGSDLSFRYILSIKSVNDNKPKVKFFFSISKLSEKLSEL